MMDKDHFLLLVTKVLSGNAMPADEVQLHNTLTAQPELLPLYEHYKRYWTSQTNDKPAELEKALAATWQKIKAEEEAGKDATGRAVTPEYSLASEPLMTAEPPVKRLKIFPYMAAAAVLLGIIITAAWFFGYRGQEVQDWVETYNPKGIRSSILLPDGSKVWLAADSKLRYPRHFSDNKRDLFLEGEAFFEVTRNPQKPFEVHLKEGSVRVLGTSFDIKAYKEQASVITSVATGKVAFMPGNMLPKDTFFLTPGKKSVFDLATRTTAVKETDAAVDKAWIDGVLQFDAETLGNIAVSLERYYGKTVVFRDERLKDFRYTGTFANSSAVEVLQFLSRTKSFVFTVSDSLIVIGK
jgi:ferric-dicitrate binding protein FerR (iron transport regulator)